MRKKITLFTLLAFSCTGFAQNCIPDTAIKSPGIYPEQLDAAIVGTNYDFTMQVLALKDTVVIYAGQTITATIDSVSLDSIKGLPAGFSYACEAPSCVFDHTGVGCIKLSGSPTVSDTGLYPLTIYTTAYARWGILNLPVADTIDDYSLLVTENASAKIVERMGHEINVYPNPIDGQNFTITAPRPILSIQILTMNGQIVLAEKVDKSLIINVEFGNFTPGLHIIKVATIDGVFIRRVVF